VRSIHLVRSDSEDKEVPVGAENPIWCPNLSVPKTEIRAGSKRGHIEVVQDIFRRFCSRPQVGRRP
jgi:hypothetical protein